MEERGGALPDLLGEHRYQLDPKGRISLPNRFREVLVDGVYLTLGQDGCLFGFTRDEWARRRAEMDARPISDADARAYGRVFTAFAEPVEVDGQGRLVIPARLRQKARLETEVVVNGAGHRLEIWNPEAWDRYLAAFEPQYVAGTLSPERGA